MPGKDNRPAEQGSGAVSIGSSDCSDTVTFSAQDCIVGLGLDSLDLFLPSSRFIGADEADDETEAALFEEKDDDDEDADDADDGGAAAGNAEHTSSSSREPVLAKKHKGSS